MEDDFRRSATLANPGSGLHQCLLMCFGSWFTSKKNVRCVLGAYGQFLPRTEELPRFVQLLISGAMGDVLANLMEYTPSQLLIANGARCPDVPIGNKGVLKFTHGQYSYYRCYPARSRK